MDSYQQLLLYLAGPSIIGLVTAIIFLWREITAYKLHVAETYVKKGDLNELKKDVREMKGVIYDVASKLGVSIQRPF